MILLVMKKNKIIAAIVEVIAPKKLKIYGSTLKPGRINCGVKLNEVVITVIIKFVNNNPNPYRTKINALLFELFDIPDDQKKKIALSSQGIVV